MGHGTQGGCRTINYLFDIKSILIFDIYLILMFDITDVLQVEEAASVLAHNGELENAARDLAKQLEEARAENRTLTNVSPTMGCRALPCHAVPGRAWPTQGRLPEASISDAYVCHTLISV